MRHLVAIAAALTLIAMWCAVVLLWVLQGWFRAPLGVRGDEAAFMRAVVSQVGASRVGNCMAVLLSRGARFDSFQYSIAEPVQLDTRFQMASISKWVTAWGVLRLVERAKLDLDVPVDRYLHRWHLPPSEFDNDGVTVRRLLSHTAGLTDGLGFLGYAPGTVPASVEDELRFARDHIPGADARVRIGRAPGSRWEYSGGGYLLLQLLIEEITQEPFASYMRREVLVPLGMVDSTFDADEVPRSGLATSFDANHQPASHYRFTALAAASLYSTPGDMSRFALAHAAGPAGEPPGRGVLQPATLHLMARPAGFFYGQPFWGLGVRLYAPGAHGVSVIGHGGQNFPAIHHAVRIDPESGDGFVVLSTGDMALASRLAEEWTFWQTGRGDLDSLYFRLTGIAIAIGIGSVVIVVATIAVVRHRTARAHAFCIDVGES